MALVAHLILEIQFLPNLLKEQEQICKAVEVPSSLSSSLKRGGKNTKYTARSCMAYVS